MFKGAFFACMAMSCLCANTAWATAGNPNENPDVSHIAPAQEKGPSMKILISFGTVKMTAALEHNRTAQDFISLLPLAVTLRDYSPAEKVSGALPRPLSEDGAPATAAGEKGDIAYYAPWGNIAFYRGQGPDAPGVIKIAKITSGIEAINQAGQIRITISKAD
ncbi:cyclophilin-like fold protein [Dickeya solani]|uniref:Cyclophilin-like fold protein n=1 Tax=Dickeya solani TaxID=1089444 RepID=A0ABU4ELB7_9GAMM|nr:cyclophilin-like fold protein [Dickeya solani]MCA6999708.1 hypothetical protein [Dickeya solani]MCZ0820347.1 cyclophilin-like fold protein [Dickeya solani]MDV6993919.1 cyclophilin-like fold protein [Dickeya solani]MDV7005275.1 cyclophilin-like fold protein [Dickeya solani]MDV7039092.1 cyclophilin-like fold protein [Dickeya solani]